jgi:hypothetical protein
MPDASTADLPPPEDWRTTDQDEINRRRQRAREESPQIVNRDARHPVFSSFDVHSGSGVTYPVEIRDLRRRQFNCGCVDFRINGLGTCKHVEAVLDHLENRLPALFKDALAAGSPRIDLVPDREAQTLVVERGLERLPRALRKLFDRDGRLSGGFMPEMAVELWTQAARAQWELRVSQEVAAWLECKRRESEAVALRRAYEQNVQSGAWPAQETRLPLFPYQREGMLHLACVERALLADEMGLGKTVQAVAACALLHRLGRAERALIVTPASLKGEWEEQIRRFSRLDFQSLDGARAGRSAAYERGRAPFFTIVAYEQMLTDSLEVNERLRPEIVILDEAQRIKNWNTKTALAVKRLTSRYAWVLTGTPLENHIDELYSLVSFLDPSVFGPLFRFNREFYEFDERGRPRGYRNLDKLRERIRPLLLRRRKSDVETELPNRLERTFLVPLSESQRIAYQAHENVALKLVAANRRRPLPPLQRDRLMRELNMLRMICDTNYILNSADRACPKLEELARILSECMGNPSVKVLVFSEWERMLELVAGLCERLRIGFARHTGGVPAGQRRLEVQRFKTEPDCRVLLSTDTSGGGLNLQNASVIIHCDLPWNPARLEQRVARAWRQDQARAVTVLHLVSEGVIEHRMLNLLASKQALSEGVLDQRGDLGAVKLAGGREDFIQRLELLLPAHAPAWKETSPASASERERRPLPPRAAPLPEDRPKGFVSRAAELLGAVLVACEERFPSRGGGSVLLVVVERDAEACREQLRPLEEEFFRHDGAAAGSTSDVRLEVMDRPAAEMLRRLAESGVVSPSLRASRILYPVVSAEDAPALSSQEQSHARSARDQHARRLKMARVLASEEMIEEARIALVAAIHELGRALAIERRQPEPANALGAVAPPLDAFWPGGEQSLLAVRTFLADERSPIQPVLAVLGQPTETNARQARDFFAGIKARIAHIGE